MSNVKLYLKMNLKLFTIILIFCLCWQTSIGQTKNEREERIKISEFPEKAQNVIEALPKNCKRLKFYKETDGNKQSFEAKFKYEKRLYSLEFSKDGTVEDIEVKTKFKRLNGNIKSRINSYFKSTFNKRKIIKIQEQFIYNKKETASKFVEDVINKKTNALPNFEIIAEVRTEDTRNIREFTFDSKGQFVIFRILNPTSYEHVLY